MFYKQIILNRGLPFEVKIPTARPANVPEMSEAELNAELEKGYADMTAGRTKPVRQAFANIHEDFIKGKVILIGCLKLDSVDYSEKLTEIFLMIRKGKTLCTKTLKNK